MSRVHRISDTEPGKPPKSTFGPKNKIPHAMRKPEVNPNSTLNSMFLVTQHTGGHSWVLYHGNNENIAKQTLGIPRTSKHPRSRSFVKLWVLGDTAILLPAPKEVSK